MKGLLLSYQDSDAVDMAQRRAVDEMPEQLQQDGERKALSSTTQRKSDEVLHSLPTFLEGLLTAHRRAP